MPRDRKAIYKTHRRRPVWDRFRVRFDACREQRQSISAMSAMSQLNDGDWRGIPHHILRGATHHKGIWARIIIADHCGGTFFIAIPHHPTLQCHAHDGKTEEWDHHRVIAFGHLWSNKGKYEKTFFLQILSDVKKNKNRYRGLSLMLIIFTNVLIFQC